MKILTINPLDYRYGATYRTRLFPESFRKLGHRVKYAEPNYEVKAEDTISFRQEDNLAGYLCASIKRFFLCLNEDYKLLFIQGFTPLTLPCLIAAKLRQKPIIVDWDAFEFTFQKTLLRKILTYITEFICPYFADYITSPSSYLINCARKRGIKNISKIPQFVDMELFNPDRFSRDDIRKKMAWVNKVILAYLCAFNPGGIRDLEVILKAVRIVMQRRQNICLLLIGEGVLKDKALQLLNQQGIRDYFIIGIDSQEKVAEYLNAADLCLIYLKDDLASRMRTSIKLCAYLAMDKSVVGYMLGESRDTFGDYIIHCQPSPESLAANILDAIDKESLVIRPRGYILEHFDCRLMPKYLSEILTKINLG